MTRARLDDTIVTLTVSEAGTRVPDDGPMGSSTGPRADRPRRRTFTAEYRLAMVAEYDRLPAGEKGALLRREGLYSSHVIEWRRARATGALTGTASPPQARGQAGQERRADRDRTAAAAERTPRGGPGPQQGRPGDHQGQRGPRHRPGLYRVGQCPGGADPSRSRFAQALPTCQGAGSCYKAAVTVGEPSRGVCRHNDVMAGRVLYLISSE
jgi:transposase